MVLRGGTSYTMYLSWWFPANNLVNFFITLPSSQMEESSPDINFYGPNGINLRYFDLGTLKNILWNHYNFKCNFKSALAWLRIATGFFLKRLFLDEALQECGVDQIYEDCKFCTLNIHSSLSFCSFSFDIILFQFQNVASTFSQSYISQVLWTLTLYCGTHNCVQ